MNNYFKEFIQKNKKIVIDKKRVNSFVFVDRSRNLASIVSSLIGASLSNGLNLNPIILSDKTNQDIIKIYKSFGFKNFVVGFRYKLIFSNLYFFLKSLLLLLISLIKIKFKGFDWFIKDFKVEDIHIGDLIYDTYIKKSFYFINPKINIYLINLLFISIYRTLNIKKLLNKNIIKFVIVNTESYCYNDGIIGRAALKNNAKVYSLHGHAHSSFTYLDEFTEKKIKNGFLNLSVHGIKADFFTKKIQISGKKMDRYLNRRLTGKLETRYTGFRCLTNANKIKKNLDKEKLLKLFKLKNQNIKKIVLFAPHAFADAPHIMGTSFIFRDYFEQFEQTIQFINNQKSRDILWLIRPHPSSDLYNEEGIVKEILEKYNDNKNIKLCDSQLISTKNLIEICDNVVTGRGTIGLEFACKGKSPITAGASTYSGLDISVECKSKSEYFKNLSDLNKIQKLKNKQVIVAKRTLYYLENIYPRYLNKKLSSLILDGHKSKIIDKKIFDINEKNQKNIFNSQLIKNLSKHKFENDRIYKHFFNNSRKLNS